MTTHETRRTIELPTIAPAPGCERPLERLRTEQELDERLAALPPDAVIISYTRTSTRHTSREGCTRGTVAQRNRGDGQPCTVPTERADLGWCWVSRDGDSATSRAVWIVAPGA